MDHRLELQQFAESVRDRADGGFSGPWSRDYLATILREIRDLAVAQLERIGEDEEQ